MTRIKHVFRQDAACLRYAALGDTAVRVMALHHVVQAHDLDAVIVPQRNAVLVPLWQAAFGDSRIVLDPMRIPDTYSHARISHPTTLDWSFGAAGWNVFESVMWENGFFETRKLKITPPVIFPAGHKSDAVMIYPAEGTDGNRVFDSDWWIATCEQLRRRGWKLNLLGSPAHPPLAKLFSVVTFDTIFPPTIDGLRRCVAASSRAIGGSTGPTWVLLMSDIPQVVLESKRSPHGYWFFDRCQSVLSKRLDIVPSIESAVPLRNH